MWFSTVLACQCYSSWKLFRRKLSFRILFIFLKLILPISYVGNPSVLSAKRSQYTKVKVNPIALYTYVKSACNNQHLFLWQRNKKLFLFLCQNRKLSFNSHCVNYKQKMQYACSKSFVYRPAHTYPCEEHAFPLCESRPSHLCPSPTTFDHFYS